VREDLSGGGDDHAAPRHVPRASLAAIVGLLDDLDEDERWEDRILRSLDHGSEIRQLRIALGRARRANWSQRLIGTAKSRERYKNENNDPSPRRSDPILPTIHVPRAPL